MIMTIRVLFFEDGFTQFMMSQPYNSCWKFESDTFFLSTSYSRHDMKQRHIEFKVNSPDF